MNVCVVGTGYVGLVTGVCFAEFGVHVTCVDVDGERIERLGRGECPIHEPRLGELLSKNLREGRLRFSTDVDSGVRDALVIFIAVGTPPRDDGAADLSFVDEVARTIARNLDGYKVIVTKSTVPVGTGRRLARLIRHHATNGREPVFDVASNPEFLREGSAVEDFLRPNRVVLGSDSPQAIAILRDLYRPLYLIDTPFVMTGIEAAELIKYAANGFLAVKITFMNEIANLCEALGVDVHVVARALGLDQRIGPKFLHPGPGFGGSCFPKDTRALSRLAHDRNAPLALIDTVIDVNEQQKARMVAKIARALGASTDPGALAGKTIGILGLTFKPNTDDVREAPALAIARELLRLGARVQAYDPAGMEAAARILPEASYRGDAYEVADGADAVVLVTEWNQFRNLDLAELRRRIRRPILLDLRNVWEPDKVRAHGFEYHGVGRGGAGTTGEVAVEHAASIPAPPLAD